LARDGKDLSIRGIRADSLRVTADMDTGAGGVLSIDRAVIARGQSSLSVAGTIDLSSQALNLRAEASGLNLAIRGRHGHILPDDQLFFLGGTTTVRGFDENMLRYDADGNSVGGLSMILGSVEARMDLGGNIEASLFWDTGTVQRIQGDSTDNSFRGNAGLGLRYQTPVGPIGFL